MSLLIPDKTGTKLEISKAAVEARARGDLGFTLADKREEAFRLSLTNPQQYLTERSQKKQDVEKTAISVYEKSFEHALSAGFSEDTARNFATAAARNTAQAELALLNAEYPNVYESSALGRVSNQIIAASPQLSVGFAARRVPRAPGAPRRRRRSTKKSHKHRK